MKQLFPIILITIAITVDCKNQQTSSDYSSYKRVMLFSKIENVQPMTGIVFWAPNPPVDIYDAISLEYSYLHYNDVVKSNETWWNAMNYCERYKFAPMGGEFSYYSREDQTNVLNRGGMYGRVFENEAAKFHLTYMIGNAQHRYQTVERIKEASMACGYKFAIEDFRVRRNRSVVLIKNTGIAPIYRNAYVAVNGVRGKQSLNTLCPGESIWIEVASGGASPRLTIECDHLVPGQKIEFEADIK